MGRGGGGAVGVFPTGAAAGAAAAAAAGAAVGGAPIPTLGGPPAAEGDGILMVVEAAVEGFGGKLILTVSFLD